MNDKIKVVTFNIRVACAESNPDNNWIARLPRIIARLRKWKPDPYRLSGGYISSVRRPCRGPFGIRKHVYGPGRRRRRGNSCLLS